MARKFFGVRRLLLCLVVLALAGCQEQEQIHSYLAPKESLPEPPKARLLAVMVPHGKDVWFFKLSGRAEKVTPHRADFDAFIRSIRFHERGNPLLTWTTPPGWRRHGGGGMRYATLRLGAKGKGLEITIIKLGAEAADVRQNLDRWRGQIALPPLKDEQYRALRDNSEVDGVKATRVDFVGLDLPKNAAPMMGR